MNARLRLRHALLGFAYFKRTTIPGIHRRTMRRDVRIAIDLNLNLHFTLFNFPLFRMKTMSTNKTFPVFLRKVRSILSSKNVLILQSLTTFHGIDFGCSSTQVTFSWFEFFKLMQQVIP